jgi:hypothetical protein
MAKKIFEKIITILKLIFIEPGILRALLGQRQEGYLVESGWFPSFKTKSSIDQNGNPIPWLSYPAIDFLTPRLNNTLTVLEYGSGNSTRYFARLVKFIDSIEHNEDWYEKVKTTLPANAKLWFVSDRDADAYAGFAATLNKHFDIILDDTNERVPIIYATEHLLKPEGVFILDDSERGEYVPGIDYLLEKGYKRIDFWGMAPSVTLKKCTTIFYKSENCLGI